jgi:hypothetical protein
MAAFAARATLIDLAVQAPFGALLLGAALAAVLYYGRLLLIGVAPPGDVVLTAPERPTRRQPKPLTRIPRARRRRGLRRFSRPELGALWQARRLAIASAAVLVLAALSIGVAGGSFGVRAAAEALPPAPSAEPGAVPSAPSASDEPLPESPQPSLEPGPSS